jgi:hypothetical protein
MRQDYLKNSKIASLTRNFPSLGTQLLMPDPTAPRDEAIIDLMRASLQVDGECLFLLANPHIQVF